MPQNSIINRANLRPIHLRPPHKRSATFISVQQAADLLGCHHTVIRRLISRGAITGWVDVPFRRPLVERAEIFAVGAVMWPATSCLSRWDEARLRILQQWLDTTSKAACCG